MIGEASQKGVRCGSFRRAEWNGSTSLSLLEALWANQEAGWRRLVRLYTPLIYRWCRRAGLSPEDAADVGQETLCSVLQGIERFRYDRPGASFRGWLRTITKNRVIDYMRRQNRQPAGNSASSHGLEQVPDQVHQAFDEANDGEILHPMVHKAVLGVQNAVDEKTWLAFWRTAVEDQPPAEVAGHLGMSVNAVYLARSRVLRRLREALGDLPVETMWSPVA